MGVPATRRARWRSLALLLSLIASMAAATDAAKADTADPQSQVNDAQQNLQNAQDQAHAQDDELRAAQAQLAAATAQLDALQGRITQLDATIASDSATTQQLETSLAADRARLADYVRHTYEHGGAEAGLVYVISAKDIAGAIERKEQVDHVATAAQTLVDRIDREAQQAQQILASDRDARAQLGVAQQQLATQQALVAVQTEQVEEADTAAHIAVDQAQTQLTAAQAALAAAQAELARERALDTIFTPVAGPIFSVDSDLTLPSGENAQTINDFLKGTPMAGLGDSFMHAEQQFHVSARYFVAHAILESNWGQSAIAHDKHNLFGFNADDANPYQDASTFPSFDACVQHVAQFVAQNYLDQSGRYYHGPTLRGMNVDYATDPNWAYKIARIADTVPVPS